MESSALIANVALIVTKDLLNDEKKKDPVLQPYYQHTFYRIRDDDEDDIKFFLQQRQQIPLMQYSSAHPTTLWPEFINQFDEETFENFLHMSKSSFMRLFDSMRGLMLKRHFSNAITTQTAFSLALWKICRDEHFEEIARNRFNIPFFECQAAIRQFWKLISHNESRFIVWPTKSDLLQNTLKPPIGVISLKILDIFLESSDQEVQVIWQIVSNAKGKILDCFVETLQNYDFNLTPIAKVLHKQASNAQTYLIGDENFPLRTYLINPYLTPNDEQEINFNQALQSALKCGQIVFDTMAKRFNTLYALESKDLYEVRRVISTICCLHNLCVDINDDYVTRQYETTKSVNWSKPVQMEYRYESQPNQDALNFRKALLNGALNFKS